MVIMIKVALWLWQYYGKKLCIYGSCNYQQTFYTSQNFKWK